ncbi:HNH endonuclease signature motif containing protein [uncultured Ruegeria sp.]|uniref:HNH endonuclease signature motif containing protein n=1 Tax=uncultured Ruegeria sp. TaxID=259304 RepID=UPI00345142F4
MAYSPLPSPEVLRQLLDYNPGTGKLRWKHRGPEWFKDGRCTAQGEANKWNSIFAGKPALACLDNYGYPSGTLLNARVRAHRVVWAICNSYWPTMTIDHINGDRADNRISNLREVSQSDNCKNTKIPNDNTSGVVGVGWCNTRGKWIAQIGSLGVRKRLGYFDDKLEAIAVRRAAEKEMGFHPNHGRAT